MKSEVVFVGGEPKVSLSDVSWGELVFLLDSVVDWKVECERRLVEDFSEEPLGVREAYEKSLRDLSVVHEELWGAYWSLADERREGLDAHL